MDLGTACTTSQIKLMLLGSGELGKEFVISAQRLGLGSVAYYPSNKIMSILFRPKLQNFMTC